MRKQRLLPKLPSLRKLKIWEARLSGLTCTGRAAGWRITCTGTITVAAEDGAQVRKSGIAPAVIAPREPVPRLQLTSELLR